jgi:hypothetical protein
VRQLDAVVASFGYPQHFIMVASRVTLPHLGGFATYRQRCEEIAAADYEGFAVQAAEHAD